MELDCVAWQQGDQHHATQFQKESSIQHMCNHTCTVCHEFGNVYKCRQSGLLHVCDANCASRVYRDPYSSICLISRKVHGPLPAQQQGANNATRKRGASCSHDDTDVAKRLNSAGGFPCSQGVFMEA